MRRLETAHHLDDGIEVWLGQQLRRREQGRWCAAAFRMRYRDRFQGDRPAGGHRDPIGILDQSSRQRPTDMAKAEQANSIRDTHWGKLPSPP